VRDHPVTTTAVCEADRHHRCAGQVISLVAPAGTPCACPCHARLEAEHFGEMA
jgi:hypothetical protein